MSHFTAMFSPGGAAVPETDATIRSLADFYRDALDEPQVRVHRSGGSALVTADRGDGPPQFVADDRGWLIVHGVLFRNDTPTGVVRPGELLTQLTDRGELDYGRLEGNFALAAWDARRERATALNDQASVFNLYYLEHRGGLYVTTTALGLARALGLSLDPEGVAEYLARGVLLAPTTLFQGVRRVNLGEHLGYCADRGLTRAKHWLPYHEPADHRNVAEAASHLAGVLVDRTRRHAASGYPVLSDLTGGLDSRLVVLAGRFAGLDVQAAVWGSSDHADVQIAREVAAAVDCRLTHCDPRRLREFRITADARRRLLAWTNGDINFHAIYHHWLVRHAVAEQFGLHLSGFGGELMRYFPWGQEFLAVGRQQPANVKNLLRYRFLQGGPPPLEVFGDRSWYAAFRLRLADSIGEVCAAELGTRNTQQCDAVYVWKMTGHSSLYLSSISARIPAVAPMLTAGAIDAAIAIPWRMRLTTGLMRAMNELLSPRGSRVRTAYGGTGGRLGLRNADRFAWQGARQAGHLAAKLDKVLLHGRLLSRWTARPQGLFPDAYWTPEFRRFLDPATMLSRNLYDPAALARYLDLPQAPSGARSKFILRVATVEQVCRELDFEPGPDFLEENREASSVVFSGRQPGVQELPAGGSGSRGRRLPNLPSAVKAKPPSPQPA